MNQKKTYVSPQVMRVKLEPTQAVLSQCELDTVGISAGASPGLCNFTKNCKQRGLHGGGNSAATS